MMTTLRMLAMVAVLALGSAARADTKMTNQDVIDMVQAKMSETTIVKAIAAGEPGFDTSAKALIKLNAAKVPEAVVQAMLDAGKGGRLPGASAGKSGNSSVTIGPDEILLIDGERQSAMRYVTPQTRTATRALGYGGIALYAVLAGPQATLRTTNQPTFLMAIPNNVQPEGHFALVSLETRKNESREVVISRVGAFTSSKSGIAKDRLLPTQIDKDADQSKAREGFTVYRVRPASPLPTGEYSVVLSNTQAKVASGLDSFFDFGVDG